MTLTREKWKINFQFFHLQFFFQYSGEQIKNLVQKVDKIQVWEDVLKTSNSTHRHYF